MTRPEFDQQLERLIVLKGVPGEIDAFWDALNDIPADVFQAAVTHALKTRTWFPAPAELRADADAVTRAHVAAPGPGPRIEHLDTPIEFDVHGVRVPVTKIWYFDCDVCSDTGWAPRWCCDEPSARQPEVPVRSCDRRNEHEPHEWVDRCACMPTNPTIQRRKAAAQRYAQAPEKVGG